jgi:hypothetical protein
MMTTPGRSNWTVIMRLAPPDEDGALGACSALLYDLRDPSFFEPTAPGSKMIGPAQSKKQSDFLRHRRLADAGLAVDEDATPSIEEGARRFSDLGSLHGAQVGQLSRRTLILIAAAPGTHGQDRRQDSVVHLTQPLEELRRRHRR